MRFLSFAGLERAAQCEDSRERDIAAALIESALGPSTDISIFLYDSQSLDVGKLDGFEVYYFEVCIFHGSIAQPLRNL